MSRVLGMLRDIAIAATFAIGFHTDAFFTAFKIPNLLRRLTAEGALTQAFVPVFNAQRRTDGEHAANTVRDDIASWLLVALVVITIIGVLTAPLIVSVIAPGFAKIAGKQELAASMLRITFPYILLISLTAFGGAILNSHGRFAAFAFAPALLNLSMIGCAVWLAPRLAEPVYALAWGVVLGGLAQLAWQIAALIRYGQLPRLRIPRLNPQVKRTLKLTGQGALGVSVAQLGIVIGLIFASFLAEGSVSWLYFADRMMELPAGLIGAALGVVALPTLSKQVADKDPTGFSATMDWALRTAMLFGLPAAVGMATLALPLAATFFQHGSYTSTDSEQTAIAIVAYSVGVPALAVVKVLAAGFFSRQDALTPVKVSTSALLVTIALNFALVQQLQHAGLALAVAIGATFNAVMLAVLLLRRHFYRPSAGWLVYLARLAGGCIAMFALLLWLRGTSSDWTTATVLVRCAMLSSSVAAGALLYFSCLFATGWRPQHNRPPKSAI